MPLSVRTWDCPGCGVSHDRDHNAAKNILDWALNGVPERATAKSGGSKAHGGETTPRSGSVPILAEVV